MEAGQEIVICPNCGSNRVKAGVNVYKVAMIVSAITIIGLVLIPFIYLLYVMSKKGSKGKRNFRCISCLHLFSVPNEKYYEYKKAIS
ncbi:hypothetical protein [Bacillus infantis]|uniref:hypothetical protein n=1 Tax=Bacillus infantis TaxID=324767 RepID=UPI003CF538E2